MAATWAGTNLVKTVWGNKKVVIGKLEATGTYTDGGDAYDLREIVDNYLTETDHSMLFIQGVGRGSGDDFYHYTDTGGEIRIFGVAGAASHTHTFTSDAGGTGATGSSTDSFTSDAEGTGATGSSTDTIPVTAGTAGDAVTNNAGVLESTGGQDLTTAGHTHTGPSHTHTGTTAGHTHTGPSHTHTGTTAATAVTTVAALAQIAAGTDITGWSCGFFAIGH